MGYRRFHEHESNIRVVYQIQVRVLERVEGGEGKDPGQRMQVVEAASEGCDQEVQEDIFDTEV